MRLRRRFVLREMTTKAYGCKTNFMKRVSTRSIRGRSYADWKFVGLGQGIDYGDWP
jgi:hypothetical protein